MVDGLHVSFTLVIQAGEATLSGMLQASWEKEKTWWDYVMALMSSAQKQHVSLPLTFHWPSQIPQQSLMLMGQDV